MTVNRKSHPLRDFKSKTTDPQAHASALNSIWHNADVLATLVSYALYIL